MAELSDLQIDAAMEHGQIVHLTEPRATSARFDRSAGRLVVELTNGCIFAVPPQLAQGPENATEDQLAQVNGHGLHWEGLDADLSVPGLLAGLFGTEAYVARRAGQATVSGKGRCGTRKRRQRRAPPQISSRLIH